MKILFIASEALPYSKTGGLADVVEALPKTLVQMGHDVTVLLPRYGAIRSPRLGFRALLCRWVTGCGFRPSARAFRLRAFATSSWMIGDSSIVSSLYGEKGTDYPDNAERFTEFARVAIEFVKRVWLPDVIHCHDWQTSLIPVLLRTQHADDPMVAPVTRRLHDSQHRLPGIISVQRDARGGLPDTLFTMDRLEFYGGVNFLKGALIYADYLSTVSRRYAQEIQTPEYGQGLEGVIRARADRLVGILNGVDYSIWSPEVDTFIAQNYTAQNLEGKKACKKDLLQQFNLLGSKNENLERPLIGIVSRFVDQKGFDLIAPIATELMKEDIALIALGTGQPEYESLLKGLAERQPARVGVKVGYDNTLAHKIEAGADMFLMPSRYEPCGLNQIYSLRYGTVPVVRATGGFSTTPSRTLTPKTLQGTGIKFETLQQSCSAASPAASIEVVP